MCYIQSTLEWRLVVWVGDSIDDLSPHLFADADFAGCPNTSRSTSGAYLCLRGPSTCFPLSCLSKRQGCVSHSTPDAEIVAADAALRTIGLPSIDLWDVLAARPVTPFVHEDNQAMIRVCETGRNPTMRHLGRTHRVSVDWLHEQFSSDQISLLYEKTDRQAGDIFTKGFTNPDKWRHAAELINILSPDLLKAIGRGSAKPSSSFEVPPQVAVPQDAPEQSNSCVSYAAACLAEDAPASSGTVPVDRASCTIDRVGCTSRTADRGHPSYTAGTHPAKDGLCPIEEDECPTFTRRFVEVCCSTNSVLGQDGPHTNGCERIRIRQGPRYSHTPGP